MDTEKLQQICLREFNREIETKQEQLQVIKDTIKSSLDYLGVLRKKIVGEYYQKTMKSFGNDYNKPLHPAMQYKNENIRTHSESNTKLQNTVLVGPIITAVPTQRISENNAIHFSDVQQTNKMEKFHIVVGNTSKFLGHTSKDGEKQHLPFRWITYVHMRDNKLSLKSYVKKVRFFLDPSYRPNDIVDVDKPPFQVSRFGWGEFTMRVRIFFHDDISQTPLEIAHKLVLDKTLSGFHTIGSETVAEFWLPAKQRSLHSRQKIVHEQLIATTNMPPSVTNYIMTQTDKQCTQAAEANEIRFAAEFEMPSVVSTNQLEKATTSSGSTIFSATLEPNFSGPKRKSTQVSFVQKDDQNTYQTKKKSYIIPDHDYVCSYMMTEDGRLKPISDSRAQNIAETQNKNELQTKEKPQSKKEINRAGLTPNQKLCEKAISSHSIISNWLNNVKELKKVQYENCNIVNVYGDKPADESDDSGTTNTDPRSYEFLKSHPIGLKNEIEFVTEVSKQFDEPLQVKDKISYVGADGGDGGMSASATCTIASALRSFVTKLLENTATSSTDTNQLTPQDICNAITANNEFDFLSNSFMGTTSKSTTQSKHKPA